MMRSEQNVGAVEPDADNDDAMIGRLLSRREMLALLGAAGVASAAFAAGCSGDSDTAATPTRGAQATAPASAATSAATAGSTAAATAGTVGGTPSCVVKPALMEGPFFVDEKLDRSDVRSDPSDGSVKPGTPLALTFTVSTVGAGCEPLAGANVYIWQCDAMGVYSDATDPTFNTKGKQFLRGHQTTDADGRASFTTIYPGWYQGRTVHIHFKIRNAEANGQTSDFTSQVFFDDALNAEVFQSEPYATKGQATTLNADDGIFGESGGQLTVSPVKTADGYAATFDIGLQRG
jgi:protocatechuate 3,4-dioxygenase beta subunit